MFWSGNYVVVRELNFLLKEENVSLSQVLEADDILQECKADNKALIQFLTRPDILSELITLITEEPSKNIELTTQYRYASIAAEVLTSQLSMLNDRLSLDSVQMNRLCDFINKDPPLNPLLASYFSKTIEMLLERSSKQDYYLYHIVCLRVLDFFKARRDFLPNLLRHISTSAIADTFKYFIRLEDHFSKIILEWLEEHQFLECLIQIICGTYVPEQFSPVANNKESREDTQAEVPEKGERELSEKANANHTGEGAGREGGEAGHERNTDPGSNNVDEAPAVNHKESSGDSASADKQSVAASRIAAIASANAAQLLCDLILNGCAGEGCSARPSISWSLVNRLQSEEMVRALLQAVFTSPAHARRDAVVNGVQVLLAMLSLVPILSGEPLAERTSVEVAVAPHLPLLHHALLHDPACTGRSEAPTEEDGGGGARPPPVGAARLQVAALVAQLAASEVEEVSSTLVTLGTPGVLVDMFFRHPDNNFLHAHVCTMLHAALGNRPHHSQYSRHLFIECDLLTRLMDAYHANNNSGPETPRSGYMGHVMIALKRLSVLFDDVELPDLVQLPDDLSETWAKFIVWEFDVLRRKYDTPLGGCYPTDNLYEVDNMVEANYESAEATAAGVADDVNAEDGLYCAGGGAEYRDDLDDDPDKIESAKNSFLELASQRFNNFDMWEGDGVGEGVSSRPFDASPAQVRDVLAEPSPWASSGEQEPNACSGEGWAQFSDDVFATKSDPFSNNDPFPNTDQDFTFWSCARDKAGATGESNSQAKLVESMNNLQLETDNMSNKPIDDASTVELANNLLTAMSSMTPDVIANIVNIVGTDLPPVDHQAPSEPHEPEDASER